MRELLTDRAAYERESAAGREAASRFVSGLDAGDLERLLESLEPVRPGDSPGAPGQRAAPGVAPDAAPRITMESLSPEKRALLLDRLRKRQAGR